MNKIKKLLSVVILLCMLASTCFIGGAVTTVAAETGNQGGSGQPLSSGTVTPDGNTALSYESYVFEDKFEGDLSKWTEAKKDSSFQSDFEIVTDPSNSENNCLTFTKRHVFQVIADEYWPADGQMSSVTFKMKFEDAKYADYGTGFGVSYDDPINYNGCYCYSDFGGVNGLFVRTTTFEDGDEIGRSTGGPLGGSLTNTKWFNVSMTFTDSNVTIVFSDDNSNSHTVSKLSNTIPAGRFFLGSIHYKTSNNQSAARYYLDDIEVKFKKLSVDVDEVPKDVDVYYSGNTFYEPGDAISITGEELGTTVADEAKLLVLDNIAADSNDVNYLTEQDYETYVEMQNMTWDEICARSTNSPVSLNVYQRSTMGVKFIIPDTVEKGVYAILLQAKDDSAKDSIVFVNNPKIDFLMGDDGEAATPGGYLKLGGNNLSVQNDLSKLSAVVMDAAGENVLYTIPNEDIFAYTTENNDTEAGKGQDNEYYLKVTLPDNIAVGDYTVSVHNGYGGPLSWSVPFDFSVKATSMRAAWRDNGFYNVQDYGAKGQYDYASSERDANTNDTAGIISALEAASKTGGTVYFPAGYYRVTTTLYIPENVTLMGEENYKTAIFFDEITAWVDPPASLICYSDNVEFENLYIYGGYTRAIFDRQDSLGGTQNYDGKAGETLSEIAAKYGMDLDEIQQVNSFESGATYDKLTFLVNKEVKIPAATEGEDDKIYSATAGETLNEIAQRFEVDTATLSAYNEFEDEIFDKEVILVYDTTVLVPYTESHIYFKNVRCLFDPIACCSNNGRSMLMEGYNQYTAQVYIKERSNTYGYSYFNSGEYPLYPEYIEADNLDIYYAKGYTKRDGGFLLKAQYANVVNSAWNNYSHVYGNEAGFIDNCDWEDNLQWYGDNIYMNNKGGNATQNNREIFTCDGHSRDPGTVIQSLNDTDWTSEEAVLDFMGEEAYKDKENGILNDYLIDQVKTFAAKHKGVAYRVLTTRIHTTGVYAERYKYIYIHKGQGIGQVREIVDIEQIGNYSYFYVDEEFSVKPNRNSSILFHFDRTNMYCVDNYFYNGRHVGTYGTAVDAVYDGVEMYEAASGIELHLCVSPIWYVTCREITSSNIVTGRTNTIYPDAMSMRCNGGAPVSMSFCGILWRDCEIGDGGYMQGNYTGTDKLGMVEIIVEDNTFETDEVDGIQDFSVSSVSIEGMYFSNNIQYTEEGDAIDAYSAETAAAIRLGNKNRFNSYRIVCEEIPSTGERARDYGDINNDGSVTIKDATILRYYLTYQYDLSGMKEDAKATWLDYADANRDGTVNTLDIFAIFCKIIGQEYTGEMTEEEQVLTKVVIDDGIILDYTSVEAQD